MRVVVLISILLQVLLFVGIAILIVGHGLLLRLKEWYVQPRLTRAHHILSVLLTEGQISPQDQDWIAHLRHEILLGAALALGPSLRGEDRQRVVELMTACGLIDRAERLCRSRLWGMRLRGLRFFTLLGGGESVAPSLLADPHPSVRAQAIEWAGDHPSQATIETLLALLAAGQTPFRFGTQEALLRMGSEVVPHLAEFLAQQHGLSAQLALEVADGLPDTRFIEPSLRLAVDPNPRTRALAIDLLGDLGGLQAEQMAVAALDDADPGVRTAALGAVAHLNLWRSGTAVARLLADDAWAVRHAAAQTLLSFGPPGRILLQQALRQDQELAVAIARQAIDLANV